MKHDAGAQPLLVWAPPCTIVAFPCSRRVGRIRRAARSLISSRSEREAAARWRQTIGGIAAHLHTLGLPDEAVQHELAAFRDAVQAEINRLADECEARVTKTQPDGAG